MRKGHIGYFLSLGLAVLLTACSTKEAYVAGEQDSPDTYGVYFPLQDNPLNVELSPEEATVVNYKVRRARTEGKITVPVVVTVNDDGIFSVEPLVFKDGENEAILTVNFPGAEVGKTYNCAVKVDDPAYISIYGKKQTGISFSVLRANWESLGVGRWRDDIISSLYGPDNKYAEVETEVFQRSDKPGYLRMQVFNEDYLTALFGITRPTERLMTTIDATDPDKVWIPKQSTGITLNDDDGFITSASYVDKQFSIDGADAQYGTLKEGVITFPVGSIFANLSKYMQPDEWYPVNSAGMFRLVLPGGHVYDYSLDVAKGEVTPGTTPINVTAGPDIQKIRYAFFDGRLDEGQISLNAQALDEGSLEFGKDILTESGTINASFEKTGLYTVVVCGYDKNDRMQAYDGVSFGFILEGDSRPVILTIGLEGTNEYGGEGITTDNSAKFYAYGEDIESIVYGLFRKSKIKSYDGDYEQLLKDSGREMKKENLDKLNNGSYSTMYTGLNGDSEYIMVLKADNGFGTSILTAEYKTTGVFNPVLETYGYDDFFAAIQMSKQALINTEWNYYAVNMMGSKPYRTYMGKVSVSASDEVEEGVDMLEIRGLAALDFDQEDADKMLAAYVPGSSALQGYYGLFVPLLAQDAMGTIAGDNVFAGYMPEEQANIYMVAGMFAGCVADGYIAFVPSPILIQQGYTFSYLFLGSQTTLYGLYSDLMLVDASKDLGEVPAKAKRNTAIIREAAMKAALNFNYVELPEYFDFQAELGNVLKAEYGKPENLAEENE